MTQLLILVTASMLAACGQLDIRVVPSPTIVPANTVEIPTVTEIVTTLTATPANPTTTPAVASPTLFLPTATQPQPIPPTSTTAGTSKQTVKIVLIALEDNGGSGAAVGCGDSAIPVTVSVPPTQGVLRAALEKLLSAKQQYYGESGLYNALYQSDLQVAAVSIQQGKAIIHLMGTLMLGGTCDAPRVQAQIEQTALQFSTVNDVKVFINDAPLEEALSTK
jgi:hypothetical protein